MVSSRKRPEPVWSPTSNPFNAKRRFYSAGGLKGPGREAEYSPTYSVEKYMDIQLPSVIFLDGIHSDKFPFYLIVKIRNTYIHTHIT